MVTTDRGREAMQRRERFQENVPRELGRGILTLANYDPTDAYGRLFVDSDLIVWLTPLLKAKSRYISRRNPNGRRFFSMARWERSTRTHTGFSIPWQDIQATSIKRSALEGRYPRVPRWFKDYEVSKQFFAELSPSGHFPHLWTEGGPICSKVCHGTVSGPTVDVVRRDAQSHTIYLAHTCMLAASGPFWNANLYFSRKYSSSRRFHEGIVESIRLLMKPSSPGTQIV